MLADELGICRQSVKKYMLALRRAYDLVRSETGIKEPGSSVVWMKRSAGGTLCGLRATIVWQ